MGGESDTAAGVRGGVENLGGVWKVSGGGEGSAGVAVWKGAGRMPGGMKEEVVGGKLVTAGGVFAGEENVGMAMRLRGWSEGWMGVLQR